MIGNAGPAVDQWWVYVVECCDFALYVGITNDLDARIDEHNTGRGARFTRSRLPVRLVYYEARNDMSSAMGREREIKSWSRARKISQFRLAELARLRSVS